MTSVLLPLVALFQQDVSGDALLRLASRAARQKSAVVALPVLQPAGAAREDESLESLGLRSGLSLWTHGKAVGLSRSDRPLLRALSAEDLARGADRWSLLRQVAGQTQEASASDLSGLAKGRFDFPVSRLQESERSALAQKFAQFPQFRDGIPSDARVGLSGGVQIMLVDPDGGYVGVMDAGGNPYDAGPFLDRLRFIDADPVPRDLEAALSARSVERSLSGTATLAEWAKRLSGEGVALSVDARAGAWRVALALPSGTTRVVDALRALGRSHNLYWRSLGDRWFLASSPEEPRAFALALARGKAIEDLIPILRRMASAGLISRDALELMVQGPRGGGDLGKDDLARVKRLLASGSPLPNDGGRLAAFISDPTRVARAQLQVNCTLNISVSSGGNRLGFGMVLP